MCVSFCGAAYVHGVTVLRSRHHCPSQNFPSPAAITRSPLNMRPPPPAPGTCPSAFCPCGFGSSRGPLLTEPQGVSASGTGLFPEAESPQGRPHGPSGGLSLFHGNSPPRVHTTASQSLLHVEQRAARLASRRPLLALLPSRTLSLRVLSPGPPTPAQTWLHEQHVLSPRGSLRVPSKGRPCMPPGRPERWFSASTGMHEGLTTANTGKSQTSHRPAGVTVPRLQP